MAHGLVCTEACRIFPDQGSNLCLLHWQADSLSLSHQGNPRIAIYFNKKWQNAWNELMNKHNWKKENKTHTGNGHAQIWMNSRKIKIPNALHIPTNPQRFRMFLMAMVPELQVPGRILHNCLAFCGPSVWLQNTEFYQQKHLTEYYAPWYQIYMYFKFHQASIKKVPNIQNALFSVLTDLICGWGGQSAS